VSKLSRSLSRLRQQLDGLVRRVPPPGAVDVAHLSDEELDRLEKLLRRQIVQEDGEAALRSGAHGPVSDLDTAPLTPRDESELQYLLWVAHEG
jgi:hypothetical protein